MINEIKTTSLREKMRPMSPEQIEKMNEGAATDKPEPKPLPWWQNYSLLRALFPPKIEPGEVMVLDAAEMHPPYEVTVDRISGEEVYFKRAAWSGEFCILFEYNWMSVRRFAFCYKKKSG